MNPNLGDELTLFQCLEILRATNPSNLPERAKFWENRMDEIQANLIRRENSIIIDDEKFRIEYYARVSAYDPLLFGRPIAWIRIGVNGSDPQSSNRDDSKPRNESDTDV